MSKLKRLLINKGSSISYAIITAIFTILPEECFKFFLINENWSETANVVIQRIVVCVVIFVVTNWLYGVHCKKRKKVTISGKNFKIQVEYGNLLDVLDSKVIINFDECYTTNVGAEPGDIKPDSICGQFLKNHQINDIKSLIEKTGVKPTKGKSQYKGLDKYVPGTIVPYGDYLLMAFTKLDSYGLGRLTYEEYLECLNLLWKQIDIWHGTSDVYMPLLGGYITRFEKDLTQQELLDIIISSYRLSPYKMKKTNALHIVCRESDGFSLNNIYGIDN